MITLEEALTKGHGQWRTFSCPAPDHLDSSPSARVNTHTGKWICMSCGAKGLAQNYAPDVDLILQDLEWTGEENEPLPESFLDIYDSITPHYWLTRFDLETCQTYRVGWDMVTNNPCYPIRDNQGRPVGITIRNLSDPGGPKYKYAKGTLAHKLLFGVKELVQDRVLVLCEGATDVMACRDVGYDAISTYGSQLHQDQIDLLVDLNPKLLLIGYDMDTAGRTGAAKAWHQLNEAGILTETLFWSSPYKDLGEMPPKIRMSTLSRALAPSTSVK